MSSIDVNEGRGGVGFRIQHVWAVLAVHSDEDEGVVAVQTAPGHWLPLIAADETRLEQITALARRFAKEQNRPLRLVRFTVRENLETFHPDGRRERAG